MQHWLQLATRNWRARQVRTAGAVLAIALGAAVVVWVSCCYESIRRSVMSWALAYVGTSHITVQSPLGKYDQIPARLLEALAQVEGVEHVNGVLVQRLHATPVRRDELARRTAATLAWSEDEPEVDLHGIDVQTELPVRPHDRGLTAGRMLTPQDGFVCVLDSSFAEEHGLAPGDRLFVWGGAPGAPFELEIVGLVQRKRIARFQRGQALLPRPVLQQINSKVGLLTSIDIVVGDAREANVQKVATRVRGVVQRIAPTAVVRTVEGRMRQIEFAQRQQEFVLMLLSCVVMLTALVTILSTLSMGMIERIGQLGLLRCIGLTGGQLGWLMFCEVLPLGLVGIAAGVPLGLGLTRLTVWLVPEYVGEFAVSLRGIGLAILAGLATTLLAAILPIAAAVTVSPMEAARPRARRAGRGLLAVILLAAVGLLVYQHFGLMAGLERSVQFFHWAALAVVVLYAGYSLLAAPAVRLLSVPAVWGVAGMLGVRGRLLQDQVGHAVWRSAGVCCGLMVGLSLIIEILVVNESVVAGWQFPRQFPEAYVWSFEQMRPDAGEIVRQVPGVARVTVANATNAIVQERRPLFMEQVLISDTFFDMVRVEMVEGRLEDSIRLLKQGGHVVVADDFARSRNKHLGDEVKVHVGNRMYSFRIAGVMRSPALDIAAGYFQAHSEFNVVASGSVLGTREDMKRFFGFDGAKLVLLDFDLPPEPVPAGWPPPRSSPEAVGLPERVYDERIPLAARWRYARELSVLREVRQRLGAPQAYVGTARELKDEIDAELTRITRLLTAVPGVALVVAALGVANLMTANVTARARQLAILRAAGATRGLVLRMVMGEALVLGAIGSGLGVLLGLHLAGNAVTLLERMWGFRVTLTLPWELVGWAIALTIGLCIVAGVLPARSAARTNIVEALRVA
jgi:putative ABC transport system permease protein